MGNLYKIGEFNIRTLLFGTKDLSKEQNEAIFQNVKLYVEETKRFQ